MPTPPMADATKWETIRALRKAKGNRTFAASLVGISRATFYGRVCALKQDPRFAKLVMAPPGTASVVGIGDPAKDAERAERKVRFLEAKVERMQAAKARPVRAAKKRSGKDDEVIVAIPDVHGSAMDKPAVAAMLADLKRLRPSRVVQLGDVIDCSGFLAQYHTMGFVAETEYSFEQDVAETNSFLDAVQEASGGCAFDELEGNHCQRPEKWAVTAALRNRVDAEFLRKQVSVEELLGLKKRGIRYYRRSEHYDGLSVQGTIKRGKLLFTHGLQRGGGGAGLQAGARMLARFGTNVAYGHYHRVSQLIERDVSQGTIGAYNLGCLCKLQPLYAHADPNSWNHGFGIFVMARSGNFLPITVPIVNGVSLLPELKL